MEHPEVGSEWVAKDGRRIRVDEVIVPTVPEIDSVWTKCTVLNPAKGTRRQTTFAIGRFGPPGSARFLTPAPVPAPTFAPK